MQNRFSSNIKQINDFAMLIGPFSVCNFGTIRQYETKFPDGFDEIHTSAAPAEFEAALKLFCVIKRQANQEN